jgi:DNA excision repair protein ERCC-2
MAIKIEQNNVYLTVRDLVYLNKKTGKMLSAFPLPQRGVLGHKAQTKIQDQKQKTFGLFHHEYHISDEFYYNRFNFKITGRIDGVYEIKNQIEVEEIKSVVLAAGEFSKLQIEKYPEFSEQVLFYSYLLSREKEGSVIKPYLTLVNIVNDRVRIFDVTFSPLVVEKLLFQRLQLIIDEIVREQEITTQRKKQLASIQFPLDEHRQQQQEMMQQLQECLEQGQHLLVSAPTGTGKTAAALYPALEYALGNNKKICFLTAKSTQQNIVYDTLAPLAASGLDLKVLFLKASRDMCCNDILFCHEDFCPYAKDYLEKLTESNLIHNLLVNKLLSPNQIFDEAKQHRLCPAEVMMDLTLHSDVIVGDYNYVFDPVAVIRRLFMNRDYSDWIVIVDEAHNLYQRGIDYFSPAIRRNEIAELSLRYRKKKSKIYQELVETMQRIESVIDVMHHEGEIHHADQQYFELQLDKKVWQNLFDEYESTFIKYVIYKIKQKILLPEDPFEKIYYGLRRFIGVVKLEGHMYVPFYNAAAGGELKIQCCDPSEHLSMRIEGFHAVIAMSATLDPMQYYCNVLGFRNERTRQLQLDSPFPTENRKLIIVPGLSTRFKNRQQLYPQYAQIIEKVLKIKEGNYIAFFPSFEFLQNVNILLPLIKSEKVIQRPSMNQTDRDILLQKLTDVSNPKLLLAVMGGIFAEGVDFSGDMCIGIIIFSPALPQVNFERELIRRYYDDKNSEGFDYAYLYPGINKVIQSMGRLIRSYQDKGIIILVGERFAEDKVNALFPEYWFQKPGDIVITNSYEKVIKDFWRRANLK